MKIFETLKIGVPVRVSQKTPLSRIVCAACIWGYDNDNDNGKRAPERAKISNFQKIA